MTKEAYKVYCYPLFFFFSYKEFNLTILFNKLVKILILISQDVKEEDGKD